MRPHCGSVMVSLSKENIHSSYSMVKKEQSYRIKCLRDFKSLEGLKDDWDLLYEANARLSHFQSFNWNFGIIKSLYQNNFKIYLLYKNNEISLIAPFYELETNDVPDIVFVGNNTHADYLDFIYNEISEADLIYFIKKLLRLNKGSRIKLYNIPENSETQRILNKLAREKKKLAIEENVREKDCFHIQIPKNASEYFESLGKSTRKELKYCSNRVKKQLPNARFEFRYREQLSKSDTNLLMQLYEKRSIEKNGKFKFSDTYMAFLKDYIHRHPDLFLSVCYVDNRVAAFNLGFCSFKNRILVLMVAMESDFKQYNIGNLLLFQTICFLTENEHLGIKYYDLTLGEELYKLKYGGVCHKCFYFYYHNPSISFILKRNLKKISNRSKKLEFVRLKRTWIH